MATTTDKTQCLTCSKENATSRCIGCLQDFCLNHLVEHRQQLNRQLDEIGVHRDLFRQTLDRQIAEREKHPLIQKIDQWEQDSVKKIQQIAEERRQLLLPRIGKHIHQIEQKLNKLTNQLQQCRQEDRITENDLQNWNEELKRLTEEFIKPSNIIIRQSSTPLINYLHMELFAQIDIPNIPINAEWIQNGITVAGGNGQGSGLNQLDRPWGIYVDNDQTVYVADAYNHRIVEWKSGATSGQVVAGGNEAGNRNDQLNNPMHVIVDKESDCLIICDLGNRRVVQWPHRNGTSGETIISNVSGHGFTVDNNKCFYVSDLHNREVRRWKMRDTIGTVVAGGNGPGSRLDQLHVPFHIFIDQDYSVYVSDWFNSRVMKWMEGAREGIVVAGGQGHGNGLAQLSNPHGVVVDQLGAVYVADRGNHRVMRWLKGATQGSVVVGGNGPGAQANQFNTPIVLSFDRENNLYVVDQLNYRVQKFNINSS